uniref:Uncharacterized protein n=1 Tax=Arundo donax TaxID=35708 RepID=A0A0A9A753_ARUDO
MRRGHRRGHQVWEMNSDNRSIRKSQKESGSTKDA